MAEKNRPEGAYRDFRCLVCFYTETAKSVLNRLLTVLFAVLTEWLECGRSMVRNRAGGLTSVRLGAGGTVKGNFVQNAE